MIIFNSPIFKIASAKSSLARNLLRVTLTFYLSLAFLLTLGQLILEYKNEKNRLSDEIENVALTFSPIISKALWNVDEDQTLASLQGMLKINKDIKKIELMDASHILLHSQFQRTQSENAIFTNNDSILAQVIFDEYDYSYSITYSSEYTQEKIIGHIVLKSNSLVVLNRAAHTFLITIISAIFKTLILSTIFYFIIQKMVGKPLRKITHKMRDFDTQNHQPYIADEELLTREDELGVMVKTFSAMTNALIIKDNDLNEYSQSLEKKVQQRTYQLEKASQAKSEFFAAMSHEIRTPLNGVLGLVNILGETPLSRDQLRYIEYIKKSGDSLIHIINNVLDNLKIESNKIEIEKIEFDLESIFNESIALFLYVSKTSSINIITIYSPECPQIVTGDPTRIRQVIINLLGNAFKFTQQGNITLHAQCDEELPETIVISISDTGIGIKEALFERLFSPYDQADSSTTRLYGGTGLGLSICKQLVELMGGVIGVESEIDKGSTFWFKIPLTSTPSNRSQRRLKNAQTISKPASLFIESKDYQQHIENLLSYHNISSRCLSQFEHLLSEIDKIEDTDNIFIIHCSHEKTRKLLAAINSNNRTPLNFKIILLNHVTTIPAELESLDDCVALLPSPFSNSKIIETIVNTAHGSSALKSKTGLKNTYPDFCSLNVIVAEDNPVNRMVIQGYLKKYNIIPTMVETGQEVIDVCLHNPQAFDLILMDGEMPEMSGWDATREIRTHNVTRPNNLPIVIVALSAHAMESHKNMAEDIGMDGFLNKPLDQVALEKILISAFESR